MAHKMLKTFAKLGRVSGLSRDELVKKLSRFGAPDEVVRVVNEVMAGSDPTEAVTETVDHAAEVGTLTQSGSGVAVDGKGFDEQDRAVESALLAALDGDASDNLN